MRLPVLYPASFRIADQPDTIVGKDRPVEHTHMRTYR